MKICKVRPDYSTCSACVATQEMFDVVDDCSKCQINHKVIFDYLFKSSYMPV